jgi:hypothetical protein
VTAALLLALASPAPAHEGPPYPILVDETVGPYVLSVWADPDVGVGTFHVLLDPPAGAALPGGTKVEIWVQPADGRIAEARFEARPARRSGGEQHDAEVEFATEERWRARFVLEGDAGGGEIATEVDVTPPGLGGLDLVWYAAPFAAVGFLWIKALLRRRNLGAAG